MVHQGMQIVRERAMKTQKKFAYTTRNNQNTNIDAVKESRFREAESKLSWPKDNLTF